MELPPINLSWFAENLSDTVQDILDAWNDTNASASTNGRAPPEILKEMLKQLIEVLRIQGGTITPAKETETTLQKCWISVKWEATDSTC